MSEELREKFKKVASQELGRHGAAVRTEMNKQIAQMNNRIAELIQDNEALHQENENMRRDLDFFRKELQEKNDLLAAMQLRETATVKRERCDSDVEVQYIPPINEGPIDLTDADDDSVRPPPVKEERE